MTTDTAKDTTDTAKKTTDTATKDNEIAGRQSRCCFNSFVSDYSSNSMM